MENEHQSADASRKTMKRKAALGKGLNALIPDIESESLAFNEKEDVFFLCDVDVISPNPYQPRRKFDEEELLSLSESIKEQGIIQPLLVRKNQTGYELVAGERRLKAAKIAGLNEVPVFVRDLSDEKLLEISIVENIQREDLNPIEEADAYHRLMTEFNLTQEEAAKRVGKSRSAVANFLRLRQLPLEIRESILQNELSMGHARALLGIEQKPLQLKAWQMVIEKKLSVRETEALVKRLKAQGENHKKEDDSNKIYFGSLEDNLSRHLGTKVSIKQSGNKGRLVIEYYNNDDLDQLINRIMQS